MAHCSMCGISIPDGQNVCSMCYGDPYYGSDGHYLRELEREDDRPLPDTNIEELPPFYPDEDMEGDPDDLPF